MVWPAIIAGAATVGASILGNRGQAAANKSNLKISREQMAFQERMSNTQYQRGVEDLRAAGLNPMLAYMGHGSGAGGASSPPGSSTKFENEQAFTPQLVSSIVGALTEISRARNLEAQTGLVKAQMSTEQKRPALIGSMTGLNESSAGLNNQTILNRRAEIPRIAQEIILMQQRGRLTDAQTKIAAQELKRVMAATGLLNAQGRQVQLSSRQLDAVYDAVVRTAFAQAEVAERNGLLAGNMAEHADSWWFQEIVPFMSAPGANALENAAGGAFAAGRAGVQQAYKAFLRWRAGRGTPRVKPPLQGEYIPAVRQPRGASPGRSPRGSTYDMPNSGVLPPARRK